MKYRVQVNNKEHTVALLNRSGGSLAFAVNGDEYVVQVAPIFEDSRATTPQVGGGYAVNPVVTKPATAASKAKSQPGQVSAPMPGVIVSIAVKEGAEVAVGAPLLVMEAMKMENSITAPRAGKIKKIHVKPAQQVENGQVLVSIE